MNLLSEFKQFIQQGNVLELAIGVAIGTAFNKIVSSLVEDVIMPPIGFALGGVDFSHLYINISGKHYASLEEARKMGAVTVNYGVFINYVIHFLIISFSLFLVVRLSRMFKHETKRDKEESKTCPTCCSSIPLQARRCPSCTSYLIKTDMRSL